MAANRPGAETVPRCPVFRTAETSAPRNRRDVFHRAIDPHHFVQIPFACDDQCWHRNREQSSPNASAAASRARRPIREGWPAPPVTCRAASRQNANPAPRNLEKWPAVPGQSRRGPGAKKDGLLSTGHRKYLTDAAPVFHRGPGVDTRINARTRSGRPAAIPQRDQAAERHAADHSPRKCAASSKTIDVATRLIETTSSEQIAPRSGLSRQRACDDAMLCRERIDRRTHPLPPPLNSRNEDDGRARADVDHQFLNVLPVFSVY